MARNEIAMLVDLVKNNNSTSKNYGQYYGRVFQRETLSLKGFARHMMEHGKRITYEELVMTLQQMVSCLKELAIQGVPVKLEGLGTFGPSIEGKKNGAVSVKAAVEGGLDTLIEGVHMNFTPENVKGEKLTSRALKDECVFSAGYVVESIKRVVNGKEKRFQNKTPISFILAPEGSLTPESLSPDPSPSSEGSQSGGDNGGGDGGGGDDNGGLSMD